MIKTLFYITLASFLVTTGCKKKDEVGQQVNYTGSQQVNFNNYMDDNGNFGYHSVDLALKDSFVNVNFEVKLTNSIGGANNDISIYFVKVDALVSDYNTENGTALEPVSSASPAVNFDFSKPLILKKGTRLATATMQVNAAKFDLNKQNALGLAILKVVGAELNSGLESKLVLLFNTRNQYDGLYSLRSRAVHPSTAGLSGLVGPYTGIPLVTTGASSVVWGVAHPWANGSSSSLPAGYEPTLTVDASNAVTVTNAGVGAQNIPNMNNRYVPGTKTFYVAWRYLGGTGYREFYDTLTYTGPR